MMSSHDTVVVCLARELSDLLYDALSGVENQVCKTTWCL